MLGMEHRKDYWEPLLRSAARRTELCQQVAELSRDDVIVNRSLVAEINQIYPGEVADLVLGSIEAQSKLRSKFGDGVWLGHGDCVMQSTAPLVADLKASWLLDAPVVDVCCGIGGDAMALARRGSVRLIDKNPAMVVAAMSNASVDAGEVADATTLNLSGEAVHIDPDRRANGNRHSNADFYLPDWDQTLEICRRFDAAIVKVAPAAELVDHADRHRAWISLSGSVREQTLLMGNAIGDAKVSAGTRSAWRLKKSGPPNVFEASPTDRPPSWTDRPSDWLIDPDRCVRAAGLTESFAAEFGMNPVGGPAGFLTASTAAVDASINQWKGIAIASPVVWQGSVDDRKLRKVLRTNHWSVEVVKVRGGGADPAALQRRYQSIGDQPVTLWMGTVGKRRYAAVTSQSR